MRGARWWRSGERRFGSDALRAGSDALRAENEGIDEFFDRTIWSFFSSSFFPNAPKLEVISKKRDTYVAKIVVRGAGIRFSPEAVSSAKVRVCAEVRISAEV